MRRRCRTPSNHRSAVFEPVESRILLAATPVVVDLLAVYTPAAASSLGGSGALLGQLQGSIDSMNRALVNSEISLTIRLVHAESITYTGSNNLYTDRTRLENPSDGFMDSVHALRNAWGADLVTLITDGATVGGGNANLMTAVNDPNNPNLAFSAIAYNSIGPNNLTLAHELGHNLGGGHDRFNPYEPVVGPFPYSVGYRYFVNDAMRANVTFFDIMSYQYAGTEVGVPYFANPAITVEGAPAGKAPPDPNQADLATTFAATAPIVAGYRTTNVVVDAAGPVATLYEIDRNGASLTFTVRYADERGIDLSTIDSNDVVVSGPGGWALTGQLIGIDHPTVAGAFKRATYRVTLPATNPTTESLTFSLKSSAVRDVSGNDSPAGAIAKSTSHDAGWTYAWAQPLGTLVSGATRTVFDSLTSDSARRFYEFSLASTQTVSLGIAGVTGDAHLYLAQDKNLDRLFQNTGNVGDLTHEVLKQSTNFGATVEGLAYTLSAGTYYVLVDRVSDTPFTLTLRAYTDTTAPTATLHATDLKTSGASHMIFAVTYSDDFDLDGDPARYSSALDLSIAMDAGWSTGWTLYPDPGAPWGLGLNDSTTWANEKSKTIYYTVPAFNSSTGWTSAENGTWTISIHPNVGSDPPRVRDGAGNNIALTTLGSFRIAIGQSDATAPAATLLPGSPVAGQTTWDFQVAYRDNVALNASTIDGSDVRVTGPGGFNQLATLVSLSSAPSVGSERIATYRVTAPSGFWDGTDDGTYTVALQANQVRDSSSNAAPAATLGTVVTSMPNVVAQVGAVALNGTNNPELLRLDRDASFTYFNLNDGTLWYLPNAFAPRVVVSGLNGSDTIYAQSGAMTGAVNGGAGTNTLNVTGGAFTLDTDAANALSINVSTGATLNLSASQRLTGLTVAGSATLNAGGAKTIVSPVVTVSGSLDLTDNDLIVNYSSVSPIGTWNGSAYDQLTGLIASGKVHSSHALPSGYHMLGIAEATDVLGITGAQTAAFSGQTVDATSVLLKFTYGGDANLSGNVDIDDYGLIDFNASTGGVLTGWFNGDFDLNGIQDIDDYGIIDFVINIQGSVL